MYNSIQELRGKIRVYVRTRPFLPSDKTTGSDKKAASNPKKLCIKRSREGKRFVHGCTEIPIETTDYAQGLQQLEALMTVAARSQSVASTKMNAQIYLGHSVFMLHLRGFNEESGAIVEGALDLCDLAGSELWIAEEQGQTHSVFERHKL